MLKYSIFFKSLHFLHPSGGNTLSRSSFQQKSSKELPIFFEFLLLFLDFIYLFLERGGRREKERERNIDVRERNINRLPLIRTSSGEKTRNPGMCLDQESNQ